MSNLNFMCLNNFFYIVLCIYLFIIKKKYTIYSFYQNIKYIIDETQITIFIRESINKFINFNINFSF